MEDFAEPCVFSKQSPPPGLCPPPLVAQGRGPLLPKLRGQFAEFLQHRSLKRLGILYQSTCVGFGYGLLRRGYFPEVLGCAPNPIRGHNGQPSSPPPGPGILTRVPIDYAFRPRLRGRLTLRGLTLRRNPWTFGDSVSHAVCRYSCQHSHFRCLQQPSRICLRRPTERSATACLKETHPQLRCTA